MQQNRESWSSAPDSRGYDGWSSAPPLTSPGHCHQAYLTSPEDPGALLPILRGYDGWSSAPPLTLTLPEDPGALLPILGGATAGAMLPRCCFGSLQRCDNPGSSWVAPRPVWPSSGGETAWKIVASRPATILMSPGQARQTIRAYHLVVRRPREGYMLAC